MQHELPGNNTAFLRSDNQWYVQTAAGQEGPWPRREEAECYLQLLRVVQAARIEMAGLELATS